MKMIKRIFYEVKNANSHSLERIYTNLKTRKLKLVSQEV